MTKSYAQIQKQIQALQKQAELARKQEIAGVVARIREAIDAYALTAEDLGYSGGAKRAGKATKAKPGPKRGAKKTKSSAAAKYRDEAGNIWVGRGPRPKWLRDALGAGKSLQDFAV
jgi:DNA-binding protein H-NS